MWYFNIFSILLLPGHSCRLHSSVSVNCPVHEPPLASSTSFVRVFILEPTPQVAEHSPLTQSFQTQCIAKREVGTMLCTCNPLRFRGHNQYQNKKKFYLDNRRCYMALLVDFPSGRIFLRIALPLFLF